MRKIIFISICLITVIFMACKKNYFSNDLSNQEERTWLNSQGGIFKNEIINLTNSKGQV
ncbi:MAG: hypothetical protein JWQ30_1219, partial [Sediminibacterium sp.]|nr:hypothetical protein [Sediminibacterium sp.]